MQPLYYPIIGIGAVVILFFFWLSYRWYRQRQLARKDELRSKIRQILDERPDRDVAFLKRHPRETAEILFETLSSCGQEKTESLCSYLGTVDFDKVLEDVKIRKQKSDYGLLVVAASLGLEQGWGTAIRWLDESSGWQWAAAIHALSCWPGKNADHILVAELARLSERHNTVDRAFNQPIIGALLSRRRIKTQTLALDYLTSFTPNNLQLLVLMFFREIEELDQGVSETLGKRLNSLWNNAGEEVKAKILSVAAKHDLTGLAPLAREAIGKEADFVQLWAVRLLVKSSPESYYLKKVRREGSSRAKKELEKISPEN